MFKKLLGNAVKMGAKWYLMDINKEQRYLLLKPPLIKYLTEQSLKSQKNLPFVQYSHFDSSGIFITAFGIGELRFIPKKFAIQNDRICLQYDLFISKDLRIEDCDKEIIDGVIKSFVGVGLFIFSGGALGFGTTVSGLYSTGKAMYKQENLPTPNGIGSNKEVIFMNIPQSISQRLEPKELLFTLHETDLEVDFQSIDVEKLIGIYNNVQNQIGEVIANRTQKSTSKLVDSQTDNEQ